MEEVAGWGREEEGGAEPPYSPTLERLPSPPLEPSIFTIIIVVIS